MAEAPPVSTPVDQVLYHVRVIDRWRPSPSQPCCWSFFGLALELQGRSSHDEQVHELLDFSATVRLAQREKLRDVVGPFTVAVESKMPLDAATERQKSLLQVVVPVQVHNTIARINKIHFLNHCKTGADVYRELERVIDSVSVAKPFELTFLRHNHAQAAAKIRPFASRPDVQQAQVTQFQKLQVEEAKWPDERKRRKQFVLQQMDITREHYLYDHIGPRLQSLHEQIMGGGQWHAYEFEKALWYYHAPTGNLYAEHPMRTNASTRQLIGGVQLRTRMAAKQLQHGVKRFLRVNRTVNDVTTRVLERIADQIMTSSMQGAWERHITALCADQFSAAAAKAAKRKKLLRRFVQRAAEARGRVTDQLLYHVRVIDPWRPSQSSQSSRWSFFGLTLELQGRRRSSPNSEQAQELLDFSPESRPMQRERLRELIGPFTLVVESKMPLDAASDQQKPLLQLVVPVQVHNTLARINKIHFLKHCATGADVYRELERVLDTVSVAKPFELTFLRHNHAQAAAKIRPFASRPDVQKAQVAQFQKLQADEAKWPDERKRRKQFVLQQMDITREHYLYDHIGPRLQSLHEQIMGGGQWHAYEFEKALWYYHAPTGNLYAEHPMRTNASTRQLIGGVQLRTRMAAKQLQHGVKRFLRFQHTVDDVTTRLLERIADEMTASSIKAAWEARATASYVDQLKANTSKAAKRKKLLAKFCQRAAEIRAQERSQAEDDLALLAAERILDSACDDLLSSLVRAEERSTAEEDLAVLAAERILGSTCDDVLSLLLPKAWEASVSESYVGHFKSNATKTAKAKKLWEKWTQKSVASAKVDQAIDELTAQAIERVLSAVCDEVFQSSVDGAWEASVAESYVGVLKANTTKAAKAKKRWEQWGHESVASAKAAQQAEQLRQQREDEMLRVVSERLMTCVGDELLFSAILNGWEARVAEAYGQQQRAADAQAATAIKLWWKWDQHRAAMASIQPAADEIKPLTPSPPMPLPEPALPARIPTPPPVVEVPTAVMSPPPSPPLQLATDPPRPKTPTPIPLPAPAMVFADHLLVTPRPKTPTLPVPLIHISSPEVETELPTETLDRLIVTTPELSIATETVAIESSPDDDEELRPWKSRLRLLKQRQHQHSRRHGKPRSLIMAPRPLAGPVLVDRSSLLLDLAVDGPTSAVLASLRQPTIRNDAFEATSPWRRNGSFRSFHAYFNAPSTQFPPAAANYRSSSIDKYASAPASKLPTVLHTAASIPLSVSVRARDAVPVASKSSPPKKLPYIRRRKP